MTKMLFKKMCRDVWRLRAQFLSILMMCFVGMLIYAGIEDVWHGMQVDYFCLKSYNFRLSSFKYFWQR